MLLNRVIFFLILALFLIILNGCFSNNSSQEYYQDTSYLTLTEEEAKESVKPGYQRFTEATRHFLNKDYGFALNAFIESSNQGYHPAKLKIALMYFMNLGTNKKLGERKFLTKKWIKSAENLYVEGAKQMAIQLKIDKYKCAGNQCY